MLFLKCLCALLCILGQPHYYRYAPMCEKVLFLVVQQLALIQWTKDIGDVGWQRKIPSNICKAANFCAFTSFRVGCWLPYINIVPLASCVFSLKPNISYPFLVKKTLFLFFTRSVRVNAIIIFLKVWKWNMILNAAYIKLQLFQNQVYYLSEGEEYIVSPWLVQGTS